MLFYLRESGTYIDIVMERGDKSGDALTFCAPSHEFAERFIADISAAINRYTQDDVGRVADARKRRPDHSFRLAEQPSNLAS
tara:strand:+ start:489 stop:734 length:246 start_codon:yes stop_codon:yes gene_type:complete